MSLKTPPGTLMGREFDPASGCTTDYYVETLIDGNSRVHIQCYQDIEPILEFNKALLNSQSSKSRKDYGEGMGKMHMKIPNALAVDWRINKGFDITKASETEVKKILNDRDYSKLRTSHGRV